MSKELREKRCYAVRDRIEMAYYRSDLFRPDNDNDPFTVVLSTYDAREFFEASDLVTQIEDHNVQPFTKVEYINPPSTSDPSSNASPNPIQQSKGVNPNNLPQLMNEKTNHNSPAQPKKKKTKVQTLIAPKKSRKSKKKGRVPASHSIVVQIGPPLPRYVQFERCESFWAVINADHNPSQWAITPAVSNKDPCNFTYTTTDKDEYTSMKKFIEGYAYSDGPSIFSRVTFTSGSRTSVMKEKLEPKIQKLRSDGFYSVETRAAYMDRFHIRRVDQLKRHGINFMKKVWMKDFELYNSIVYLSWMPIGGGLFFTGSMIVGERDIYADGLDRYDVKHPLYSERKFTIPFPSRGDFGRWYRSLPVSLDLIEEEEIGEIAPKDEQPYLPFLEVKYSVDLDQYSSGESDNQSDCNSVASSVKESEFVE